MNQIQTVDAFILAQNQVAMQAQKEQFATELMELKQQATLAVMRFIARKRGHVKYSAAIAILSECCGVEREEVKSWIDKGIDRHYAGRIVELLNSLSHIRWGKYQVSPSEQLLINTWRGND